MQTRSSKRKAAGEIARSEKTTPLPSSAHIPPDLVASSAMGSLDSLKTTTSQQQGDMADTTTQSTPLDKPDTALRKSTDSPLPANTTGGENMPSLGFLESQLDENNLTSLHANLASEISLMVHQRFQPTPWDKLKPDHQVKLKRWTPDARLLIESEPGYSLIFRAWIWHILDDGVFSADPKTKWQDYGDGYEAVKLFSQFLDIIQKSEDTNDNNDCTSISKVKDHRMWYTSEFNKWRSVSAELALQKSYKQVSIHRDYVGKLIDSNLGYLMKPFRNYRPSTNQERIGDLTATYDATLLICRVKPRLVWTDPFKQDEQGVLYGFPFTNKVDPKQEMISGAHDDDGTFIETRMETEKPRVDSGEEPEVLRTISEGKPVQLVISPGVMTRGWTVLKDNKPLATDWHLMFWRHPMIVVVPDTFDPPIKPATFKGGKFLPAS
ncbi:hypothetical protein F5Y03DRAFT_405661 [Xylaria venustula]|nr:hypothetical protein F5Y03DRAFT_405661 [Xylaria venustula]